MQTARNLVAAAAEFTAGVQNGQNNGQGGDTHFVVNCNGDSSSVITDGNDIVGMYFNLDMSTEAGECLVDGVIDNLVNQVVKSSRTCRADIHTGPFTNGLKTFKNLYLVCAVFLGNDRVHSFFKQFFTVDICYGNDRFVLFFVCHG